MASSKRCSSLGLRAAKGPNVEALAGEVEQRAVAAAENWDTDVTEFLEPEVLSAAEERLKRVADGAFLRAGGYDGAERARLVLTRSDLLEASEEPEALAQEHAVLLYITADLGNSDPLPNALDNIGISLDDVGDILSNGEGEAYMVVSPDVASKVQRLLKKELSNVLAIEVCDWGVEPEGELQEMVVKRLDKRQKGRSR